MKRGVKMEMFAIYLLICLIGFILLIVLTLSGGLADLDMDVGDVDMGMDTDIDVGGHADMDVGGHADAGDMDGGGGSPSFLSLPLICLFMTGFGGFGAIFEILGFDPILGGVLALVGGFGVGLVGFWALVKFFAMVQADSTVKMQELVGKRGSVQVPIKKGKEGQIMLITHSRGRFLVGAIADENIPNEAVVMVEEVIGDIVKVKKVDTGAKKKSGKEKETGKKRSTASKKKK
jgi:hypothetical protein